MRNSSEAGRGVEEWGPHGHRGRILGQMVDTKALDVAIAVTLAVTVSMDNVLETHRGCEDVAVAVAMIARGWCEEMKLVSYWWHTVTMDMAVKDCHEYVKLAGCW